MSGPPVPAPPAGGGRCVLQHPVFACLGAVAFRPAEGDGTPVMVFPLGAGVAAIPLHPLQVELGIEAASPDGRMLALVARALSFVPELRLGDPLPPEVLDGGASWQPSAQHARVAEERLRLRLAAAFDPSEDGPCWARADPGAVLDAADDPALDARLQFAAVQAAPLLGLPDAPAVVARLAAAAAELAYAEALRDRLLRRVELVLLRLQVLGGGAGYNGAAVELHGRVRRLAGIAYAQLRARFAELQAHAADVLELLRRLEDHAAAIRRHRDWLYGSLRAWEDLLLAWDNAGGGWSQDTSTLLRRTYRFLAPRYMPVQEWAPASGAYRAEAAVRAPMIW